MTLDAQALLDTCPVYTWGGTSARRATPTPSSGDVPRTPELERAHALAAHLPPSVSGHGGDEALLKAATELSTVLGEDARAIEAVLVETYNPRCAPPWPATKLAREAERAAGRQGSPEARYARRAAMRGASAANTFTPSPHVAGASGALGAAVNWGEPAPPIDWYCKALGIAPSERKVTLIGGDPGAGKGPFAGYLAACFALGLPVFGAYDVKQCNVGVLDFEGARLSQRRIESHVRGLGREPAELAGRLHLHDADPSLMANVGAWLPAWLEAHAIEVLVVDSYMSAMSAFDVDPNAPEYAHLARELGKLGIVVIVVAHARKPAQGRRGERPALGDVAGSYALAGMAATGIGLWKPDEDDANLTRIGCMRAPDGSFPTIDVQWSKSGPDDAPVWSAKLVGEATRETRAAKDDADDERQRDVTLTRHAVRIIARMRMCVGFPQAPRTVCEAAGVHHKYGEAILSALARAGCLHFEPDIGRKGTYTLLTDDACPDAVTFRDGDVATEAPPPPTRVGQFTRPS